jgi:hypothetical protein
MPSFRHIRNVRGFFSDYYLGSVFGRGTGRGARKRLSDRDTDTAYRRFQRIFEQAEGRVADASTCRERFVRPLMRDVLGFHLGEGSDRVCPLRISAEAAEHDGAPLAVVYCGAWDEDLDAGKGNAVPVRRIEQNLAASALGHGLLVTGERIRLVRAAGDGPRGAYIEVDLAGLADEEDPESFAAFFKLFHISNFVPGDDGQLPIRRIEKESREHAEKVSEDLKRAVFSAAETLVGGLLTDAVARGRLADPGALSEADLSTYRDAALTALYRILFILYAEARDPRLDEHRIYRDAYSMHGLVEDLLRQYTRQWPENRSELWARLKALFKIYDQGLPAITPWENIPPRGGDFFNEATPEGRILDEARLPDRAIARLLLDLTTTAAHRGVGRERVSFRELDIESLGAVYEGLLEFEPRVAPDTMIELRVQGHLFVLSAADVVRLCREKGLSVKGDFAIVEGTAAEGLHPDAPVEDEDDESDEDAEDEEEASSEDAGEEEAEGVKKGATARLFRRLDPGTFHFVPGPSRKGSGSFYTPRPLVQDLVRHALEPLVEGKSSGEIESLRVLDPACGSAHFLVEAMRFLGRELHRAYVREHQAKPPPGFRSTTGIGWDDNWQASDEEARVSNSEARAWCKRRIAERCLFGVDLNPTAVGLAHVALWIESLAGDRPLTYFEHHVRCGNSLLGTWLDRLDHPPLPSMAKAASPTQGDLFAKLVRDTLKSAAEERRLIDRAADEGAVEPDSIEEQQLKEHQHRKVDETLAGIRLLFDLRSASAFLPEIWAHWASLCTYIANPERLRKYAQERPWWQAFLTVCERERFFHWELEFPEIFGCRTIADCRLPNADCTDELTNRQSAIVDRRSTGFDAVLGNPPWDKVLPAKLDFYARHDVLIRAYRGNELDQRIRELHGGNPGLEDAFSAYRERTTIAASMLRRGGDFPFSEARSAAAHEDVSKYFIDRAARIVGEGGAVGMVVPSVVYNGDGCVGIRRFLLNDAVSERFYGFENRMKIFPIDSRYKFVNLVFRKCRVSNDESRMSSEATHRSSLAIRHFEVAFMRHDLGELTNDDWQLPNEDIRHSTLETRHLSHPWLVTITRDEIARLSPETLAFLEYRSPRDQEIVHRMHLGRPTLNSNGPGSWGVTFISWRQHNGIYNSAEDKDLWTDPQTGRMYTPEQILTLPTPDIPHPTPSLIERMREKGFWPVFEGKHIDQFLVGTKPVRWWLSVEQAERKYGKAARNEPTLVFRETASNTNERTCIAAVLPAASGGAHTLCGALVEHVDPHAAATVLNSLCFDWALRLRTAGTHVSFTYMRPMPVPPADVVNRLPRISTQLAWEKGIGHITDNRDLWPLLWEANRAVAGAYGLTPDDFEHILGSFPVFARKRKEFFAYLMERLSEWKREVERDVVTASDQRAPAIQVGRP